MVRRRIAFLLLPLGLLPVIAAAEEVTLTIHPDRVVNRVDEKIYGHFLEHIYHSCNGGLWGELIWDRSFEGTGVGVAWRKTDEMIEQRGSAADVRLTFGSPQWTDYEFTVEARKIGGDEGFLLLLRSLDKEAFYWANLGGWGNVGHALERGIKGGGRWNAVTRRTAGKIESDRWYQIRARCKGPRIQVWLDGECVIDYTDDGKGPSHGRAGVGTWNTLAQFRNFHVVSLDGKTLYEGLPPLPTNTGPGAPAWSAAGSSRVATRDNEPLNGDKCMSVETRGDGGGLVQRPVRVVAGETYCGSLWVRGEAPGGFRVRLSDGEQILAEQRHAAPSGDWKEFAIELTPTHSSDNASLDIWFPASAAVCLDQVSVMPDSWRKAGGCRPDLQKAIAELKPPVIRWPGGCFASPYRWKDAIGPQTKRRPHPRSMWDDKDVNSFGTDAFVAMCRRVGAEPLIVVNIGTRNWNEDADEHDFLQDALDWIQYCNGPADSKWGKVRAANGHPEPYHVRFWEIDNETWHMGADAYAAAVNRFGPAMRKADPSIRLAACGSGGYNQEWNRSLIHQSGKNFDFISTHHYEGPNNYAVGPAKDEAFYRELKKIIDSGPNPDMKVYCSEWNAQSTDWRTGLYCGGILNVFERCGDFFEMGGPALFLRHVSATAWDNAFINFDHRTWFPAPNYVVMKLWRDHYAPNRVAVEGDRNGLNVVATRSEDSKKVFLKVVNATDEVVHVTTHLSGMMADGATLQLIAPGDLQARNTLDDRHAVRSESAPVKQVGQVLTFTLPPLSCGVVEVLCD